MAISFSRPDPSSPASVADAAFGTSRRGFDQQEVRDFLRMVAAELARLQERVRFLERELRTAQAHALPVSGAALDDETATRLLGEEAARILQAAREGGASIRARAEDAAAQLLREAADEARRLREESELDASRRRSDASADAEAELAMAKQQGREMVDEARAYRERVLGELARRRDLARQQIEQLIHGRDRLLQAFERARLVAVDVVAELSPLSEPEEYVDLTPTTGPVPIMVPAANLGDRSSVDDIVVRMPPRVEPTEESDDELDHELHDELDEADLDEADVDEADVDEADVDEADEVDFTGGTEQPDADAADGHVDRAEEVDGRDATANDVDALFARLRAAAPPSNAAPEPTLAAGEDSAAEPSELSETPFQVRDAALVPLIVAAARRLKRVLADEQNEVLDALRRSEPVRHLDALLPWEAEQATRYTDAVTAELIAAAEAGAVAAGTGSDIDIGPDGPLAAPRGLLAGELVAALRERLERAVAEGEGDNDAVARRARGVYREWKTQRIDEQLDDVFRVAFCQGTLAAIAAGGTVTWVVDPAGPPSPDCEDNALAGAVVAGEAFPSGHVSPPMHPGCRCLLVPAG